jgi:AcrR family transcriptional regulator
MATTSRGARSRQKIVAAGAELFAERGFVNTSLNDVLDRVGLTKGAFYFHFPTKEDLAQAVTASYRDWLLELQRSARSEEPEPLRRIPRVLLHAAVAYRRDAVARATTRLLEESNQLDLPHLSPIWVPWWTETLTAAQARGQLECEMDTARLAWMLTAAWYGVQSNSHAESNWVRLPGRVVDLLRFTLLPAITDAGSADALRADLERLPGLAREMLGEQAEQHTPDGGLLAVEDTRSHAGAPDGVQSAP